MPARFATSLLVSLLAVPAASAAPAGATPLPRLAAQEAAVQLIVDEAPFIIRGGEPGNCSGEPEYPAQFWPRLQKLNLNTFAGKGVTVTFATLESGVQAGIESVVEGGFEEGAWKNRRWLNGDQTHRGRHVRLEPGRIGSQRVKLYRS